VTTPGEWLDYEPRVAVGPDAGAGRRAAARIRAAVVLNCVSAVAGAVAVVVVVCAAIASNPPGEQNWDLLGAVAVTVVIAAGQVIVLLACTLLAAVRAPPARRRRLVREAPFGFGLSVLRTAFVGLGLSAVAIVVAIATLYRVLDLVVMGAVLLGIVAALRWASRRKPE
jgi:hypothetical protein